MLAMSPGRRPSAAEALWHPYFAEYQDMHHGRSHLLDFSGFLYLEFAMFLTRVSLQKLLVFSGEQRISASRALTHPYFSEFGFTPISVSPTSDLASEASASSMSEASGSSEPNTSLSPVNASTSFSSHETSGDSLGDLSGLAPEQPS